MLSGVKRTKPMLDGVDDNRADAFARWRILSLRAAGRQRDYRPRLSLVAANDINSAGHLPEDVGWWEPAARAGAPIDDGLAVEIIARLLHDVEQRVVAVWSRRGPNDEADSDLCWWAAIRRGAAIVNVATPSLLIITVRGWRCYPDGGSRTWQRLRHSA